MLHSRVRRARSQCRTHLPGPDGAFQWALLRRQRGVGVLEPGQRGLVGVEVGCFIGRVEEPALEGRRQGGSALSDPSTHSDLLMPPYGKCSPSCQRSPRSNRGRASGRERQNLSLWGETCAVPALSCPHPTASQAHTCDPKAVGSAGARDAERRWHVVLEEGSPLGEVVVPEEIEGV